MSDEGFLLEMDVETAAGLLLSTVCVASLSAVVAFTDVWAEVLMPTVVSGGMFVWFLDLALRERWP